MTHSQMTYLLHKFADAMKVVIFWVSCFKFDLYCLQPTMTHTYEICGEIAVVVSISGLVYVHFIAYNNSQ